MSVLEPVDRERCQTDIKVGSPWRFGDSIRWTRCPNKPSVIVTEVKAGADGQRGAMSLCASCLTEFNKKVPPGTATVEVIV